MGYSIFFWFNFALFSGDIFPAALIENQFVFKLRLLHLQIIPIFQTKSEHTFIFSTHLYGVGPGLSSLEAEDVIIIFGRMIVQIHFICPINIQVNVHACGEVKQTASKHPPTAQQPHIISNQISYIISCGILNMILNMTLNMILRRILHFAMEDTNRSSPEPASDKVQQGFPGVQFALLYSL